MVIFPISRIISYRYVPVHLILFYLWFWLTFLISYYNSSLFCLPLLVQSWLKHIINLMFGIGIPRRVIVSARFGEYWWICFLGETIDVDIWVWFDHKSEPYMWVMYKIHIIYLLYNNSWVLEVIVIPKSFRSIL